MASVFQQEKFIKTFIFVHGKDELMNEDLEFLHLCSNLDDSPLFKIHALKDMGNDFYKQNLFDAAGECYDRACRVLCHTLKVADDIDVSAVSDLAKSLNLNLAACASKLQAYEAAVNFCSMVLYAFPSNIKALYRRGIAYMKLNNLLEARKDLEDASLVDPKNKDVQRELNVLTNLLLVNSNGKRCIVDLVEGDDRGGKKAIPSVETNNINVNASCVGEVLDYPSGTSGGDAVSDMDTCIASNDHSIDNDNFSEMGSVSTDRSTTSNANKSFQFRKNGKDGSFLKINYVMYQNLLNGKEVCCYQGKLLTTLKVRIFKPCECVSEDSPSCVSPKRNGRGRRRTHGGRGKRRKGNIKEAKNVLDSTIGVESSPSGDNLADGLVQVNSSVTTTHNETCEAWVKSGKNVLEESTIDVENSLSGDNLVCEKAEDNLSIAITQSEACEDWDNGTNNVPFIFSSKGGKRRRITRFGKTTRISTKDEGGESPGYSVGVFDTTSCFFPRARHVSVSCCRYSPESFKMKKRMILCSPRSSPNPAMKKPRLSLAHLPSLLVYNSVVIKTPDISRG